MPDADRIQTHSADQKTQQFLRELTELTAKHGIGITGKAQLFLMERDDFERAYKADAESRLDFI